MNKIYFLTMLIVSSMALAETQIKKRGGSAVTPPDPIEECRKYLLGRYEYAIKASLRDPDSYDRSSWYYDDSEVSLRISYTAKNLFGGRVKETKILYFEDNWCGRLIKIVEN